MTFNFLGPGLRKLCKMLDSSQWPLEEDVTNFVSCLI